MGLRPTQRDQNPQVFDRAIAVSTRSSASGADTLSRNGARAFAGSEAGNRAARLMRLYNACHGHPQTIRRTTVKLRTSILAVALSALLTTARLSAEPATSSLEGLWEVLSITNLTTGKVQPKNPEYHMYTATHEMIILTGKDRKRIKKSLLENPSQTTSVNRKAFSSARPSNSTKARVKRRPVCLGSASQPCTGKWV